MARVDLTVRGGGIFGLSCAWAAARRGARVRLIEPVAIGAGASGGLVGALAPHVPENWNDKKQFQLDSLLMAEGWWAAVQAAGGADPGYLRSGRLQPLADAAAVEKARERQAWAARNWGAHAIWEVVPASGAAWEPTSASGHLLRDTLSARLSPRHAGQALLAALRAVGAEVLIGRDGAEEGAVIHATGVAGLADLGQALGRPVGGGQKGQAAAFAMSVSHAPQLFVDGLHIVPHADGTVAIGSTSERSWDDPTATDAAVEVLIDMARTAVPALAGARVIERWAGIRPRSQSRSPILGAWPGRPGHFVANGGFKIGFGMAPRVAEVMADLVLEGRDAIPDGFRVAAGP